MTGLVTTRPAVDRMLMILPFLRSIMDEAARCEHRKIAFTFVLYVRSRVSSLTLRKDSTGFITDRVIGNSTISGHRVAVNKRFAL